MISIGKIVHFMDDDRLINSRHLLRRMRERSISFTEIRECIKNGEIIEQYPESYPFPSCLICGKTHLGRIIHVVVSDEGEGGRIITAYIPNKEVFGNNFKKRRR